ncbi:MAG: FprA family A-type flavoprotein [Spirochaetaceae bacterium]|jgi:flavorubredoxin|nr:FprA family A-type flavoprotein [Spirochaetaceae bacterium]
MHQVKKVVENLYWVGGNDRRLALFENAFPIPRGISYNAYLLLDTKTVLFDTVDKAISEVFYENLDFVLNGRTLDYVVINHVEPDHCANLALLVQRYPAITIVGNKRTGSMLKQFFSFDAGKFDEHFKLIAEGDTLETGAHTLKFAMAPMVHWPEAMVTYDMTAKVLFSADAFGTFGALNGHIFADELEFEREWLPDARRYYANIVGKYGSQVQALLAKTAKFDVSVVCPLHGPCWRKDFDWYLKKYQLWSTYKPEDAAVMIAYGSIYGHTENAAMILAANLAEKGVHNIKIFDASSTHVSEIVAEAFRCSHLVFASATYNGGIFCSMETLIHHLIAHNLQNRTIAFIENGSWGLESGRLMRELCAQLKNTMLLDATVNFKSAVKEEGRVLLENLAGEICNSMAKSALE